MPPQQSLTQSCTDHLRSHLAAIVAWRLPQRPALTPLPSLPLLLAVQLQVPQLSQLSLQLHGLRVLSGDAQGPEALHRAGLLLLRVVRAHGCPPVAAHLAHVCSRQRRQVRVLQQGDAREHSPDVMDA